MKHRVDTAMDKRVRSCSTSLYHSRQCGVVLKPRSDGIENDYDYGSMTHGCIRKSWKQTTLKCTSNLRKAHVTRDSSGPATLAIIESLQQ